MWRWHWCIWKFLHTIIFATWLIPTNCANYFSYMQLHCLGLWNFSFASFFSYFPSKSDFTLMWFLLISFLFLQLIEKYLSINPGTISKLVFLDGGLSQSIFIACFIKIPWDFFTSALTENIFLMPHWCVKDLFW